MVRASAAESNPEGGGNFLGIGKHHVMVESCEAVEGNFGTQVVAEVLCLASTAEDQVGRKRKIFLDVAGSRSGRFWQFLYAVGLVTKEEWKVAKEDGTDREIDETEAIGRQLCVEVVHQEYTPKATAENPNPAMKKKDDIGFGMWPIDGKDSDGIPKSQPHLDLLGGGGAGAAGNGAGNGGANGGTNGGSVAGQSQPAADKAAGGTTGKKWDKF